MKTEKGHSALSPFDPGYKSNIDMSDVNSNTKRSQSLSRHVTAQRRINPMFGTQYGIGELVVDKKLVD